MSPCRRWCEMRHCHIILLAVAAAVDAVAVADVVH